MEEEAVCIQSGLGGGGGGGLRTVRFRRRRWWLGAGVEHLQVSGLFITGIFTKHQLCDRNHAGATTGTTNNKQIITVNKQQQTVNKQR